MPACMRTGFNKRAPPCMVQVKFAHKNKVWGRAHLENLDWAATVRFVCSMRPWIVEARPASVPCMLPAAWCAAPAAAAAAAGPSEVEGGPWLPASLPEAQRQRQDRSDGPCSCCRQKLLSVKAVALPNDSYVFNTA
eukprot:765442-Pelagomonas_calceolata.AAC.2